MRLVTFIRVFLLGIAVIAASGATARADSMVTLVVMGQAAPDFVALDADQREVRLSDHLGKVVVLDFWATWCGPCVESMAHTNGVAGRYQDQGVVVLASCTKDSWEKFTAWVAANRDKYPHLDFSHDPAGHSAKRASLRLYGVTAIPQQFIIGRDGRVVAAVTGYVPGDARLEAALAKAGITVNAGHQPKD